MFSDSEVQRIGGSVYPRFGAWGVWRFAGWVAGWSSDCLACWLAGLLAGWQHACVLAWLADCLLARVLGCPHAFLAVSMADWQLA